MRFGSEGNKLFFMNNSILCSYDGNAIKQYDSVTEPGNDYSIINDESNTTYLLYNANNGDNSQLYLRIYDPSNDTWKQPIALTNTPAMRKTSLPQFSEQRLLQCLREVT